MSGPTYRVEAREPRGRKWRVVFESPLGLEAACVYESRCHLAEPGADHRLVTMAGEIVASERAGHRNEALPYG